MKKEDIVVILQKYGIGWKKLGGHNTEGIGSWLQKLGATENDKRHKKCQI